MLEPQDTLEWTQWDARISRKSHRLGHGKMPSVETRVDSPPVTQERPAMRFTPPAPPAGSISMWNRFRDAWVYHSLAFAEPAESIELARLGLQVKPGDTVAGITSSGDVLLSLLGSRPDRVYGFDANPTQTALARLKLLLCETTPLASAVGFLGLGPQSRQERFETWNRLRAQLGSDVEFLERYDLRKGILNCGMSRKLIAMVCFALRACLGRREYLQLISSDTSPAERLRIHHTISRSAHYRCLVKPVLHLGSRLFRHFLYPPAFCRSSDHPRNALRDLLSGFEQLFEIGFRQNPVFCRYLTGSIPQEQIQHLYSPPAWAVLKEQVGVIQFETCPIEMGLRNLDPTSTDAFYLSNSPDYLRPNGLRALVDSLSHAARPGARIYYLSLEPDCPFARSGIALPFRRIGDLERRLHLADPVGLYPFVGLRICD